MGKSPAKHPGYEELKDTPWITQGRDIAQRGGEGIIENYNRVNVFDEGQRESMDKLNEDAYRRAFADLNKGYREGMNKYASANYNRFGSLNSTPSSYITDEFNRRYQRDMANLAYDKAINYENLVNQELQRRYNTLGMYQTLYNMGQIPYQQDVQNWQIRNKNRDIAYENAKRSQQAGIGNVTSIIGASIPASETIVGYLGKLGKDSSGTMSTFEPVDVLDDYLHGDLLSGYGDLGGQVGG